MKAYLRAEVNKMLLRLRAFILVGGRINSQSVSCADRQGSILCHSFSGGF